MSKISMKLNEGKTIQQGFDEFIRHCKVKNYSKDTIKYYENVLHNFELFCTLDTELSKVNSELLDKYMLHLRKKNLADKTLKTYMGGMRTILYCYCRLILSSNRRELLSVNCRKPCRLNDIPSRLSCIIKKTRIPEHI